MPIITPAQTENVEMKSMPPGPVHDDAPAQLDSTSPPPPRPGAPAAGAPAASKPPRHTKHLVLAVGVLVLLGVAGVVGISLMGGGSEEDSSADGAPIRAVEATTGDLTEITTVSGVLAYGDPVFYTAASEGTITNIAEAGDVLIRGDVAWSIDESPVVVFWGDTPLYRPLGSGVDDGADIEVLEANLVALGYDTEGGVTIDQEFDAASAASVEEMQRDMGMTVDGTLSPSSVLLLGGPVLVSDVTAPLGSAARIANPVMSLQLTTEATTVVMPAADGLITQLPTVGTQLATGDMAFEIDTEPVIVVIGEVHFDRILTVDVDDGDDIALLEQTLVELGFDADGNLVVDEHFDSATEEALAAWEETIGLGYPGVLDPNSYVVLPAGNSVTDVAAERGDSLSSGEIVFTAGVSTQTLTATIDRDDADLITIGDRVEVDFADTTIAGTIIDIDDPVASPGNPDVETVEFEISLDGPPPTSDSSSVDVEVQIVEQIATGVTLVPASALVSVGDGTYAVEVVRGSTTAFVSVVPGDFSDGMVEVEGIEPGTAVVVPS